MLDPLAIIFLAGLIHASFQLSISVMVAMSGHALGKKTSNQRVTSLTASFSLGAFVMVAFLLSFLTLYLHNAFRGGIPYAMWSGIAGLAVAIGIAVWIFYYRYRASGTTLWVPRAMATHLLERARATKHASEAFSLGLTSIVSELLFACAPLLITAGILASSTPPVQLWGLLLYSFMASLPLFVVTILVGGGHSLARIQRWRELNKRFLQFAAGSALIVLGVYVYVDIVLQGVVGQ